MSRIAFAGRADTVTSVDDGGVPIVLSRSADADIRDFPQAQYRPSAHQVQSRQTCLINLARLNCWTHAIKTIRIAVQPSQRLVDHGGARHDSRARMM